MTFLTGWSNRTLCPSKFTFPLTQMSVSSFFLFKVLQSPFSQPLLAVSFFPQMGFSSQLSSLCTYTLPKTYPGHVFNYQVYSEHQELLLLEARDVAILPTASSPWMSNRHLKFITAKIPVSHTKTLPLLQLCPFHFLSYSSQKHRSYPWFLSFTHSLHPICQQALGTS